MRGREALERSGISDGVAGDSDGDFRERCNIRAGGPGLTCEFWSQERRVSLDRGWLRNWRAAGTQSLLRCERTVRERRRVNWLARYTKSNWSLRIPPEC